jgi:hypothetical protein
LNHTIPATGGLTVLAIIRRVIVTIVATFAWAKDPITAARLKAVTQASVSIILIAVVAGFITDLPCL